MSKKVLILSGSPRKNGNSDLSMKNDSYAEEAVKNLVSLESESF